jgi:hypothetical protein
MHRDAQGDGAVDFIEKMDCLNISLPSDITTTEYRDYSNHPQVITIDRD